METREEKNTIGLEGFIDLRWFIMMCGYSIGSVQIEKMSKNRGGKLQLHM